MRVAVVGSGVTGLAATWLLNEYSPHEVHLYEADDRPGGHANTVHICQPGKEPADVDTAFITFNPLSYPNFFRFVELHKRTVEVIKPTNSFSVSRDGGAFEWAGDGLRRVFCHPRRIFDLGMWRMLFDIMRFNACAARALAENDDVSIREYLQREGYSSRFKDDYLIPIAAALWSNPPDAFSIDFPMNKLIRFMHTHHMMQITGKPPWLTFKGGSKTYIESILSQLPSAQLHLSTPVHAVWSEEGNVIIETATGKRETFDHIIFACHTDDALRILDAGSGATPAEREVLGAFRWTKNEVWLHSDDNLMPRSRLIWSCWNYIARTTVDEQGKMKANGPRVSLTYWMNDIQSLPPQKHGQLFVTLNPPFPPSPTSVLGRYAFSHPVLSADSVRAQRKLALLNAQATSTATGPESGRRRVFAGGWTHYGFHEDGFASGLRAAAALPGVAPPFTITDADDERGKPFTTPVAWLFDVLEFVRAFTASLVGTILLVVFRPIGLVEQKKVD